MDLNSIRAKSADATSGTVASPSQSGRERNKSVWRVLFPLPLWRGNAMEPIIQKAGTSQSICNECGRSHPLSFLECARPSIYKGMLRRGVPFFSSPIRTHSVSSRWRRLIRFVAAQLPKCSKLSMIDEDLADSETSIRCAEKSSAALPCSSHIMPNDETIIT